MNYFISSCLIKLKIINLNICNVANKLFCKKVGGKNKDLSAYLERQRTQRITDEIIALASCLPSAKKAIPPVC